jgi:broad specificity phosphatase PhoE
MSEPTTILLIRHADVHNPNDVVYGRLPRFGLSEIGREEAARTAQALAATPLAAFYTSPQLRARQTARAIAALHPGLQPRVSRLLAEVRTNWQGVSNAEMAERRFNFYEPPSHPDDESMDAVAERVLRWIGRMLRAYPGQTVAGVSHGDPVMFARLALTGQDRALGTLRNPELYPPKGSITRLVFRGVGDPATLPVEVCYEDPNREARAALGLEPDASGASAPWAARSEVRH